MAPSARYTDPPKTPPTATATAAESPEPAPAVLMPLPPGYKLGPLVVYTVPPGTDRRETFGRSVVAPAAGLLSCRGRCPAEALALVVVESWEHYFSRRPNGVDAATREACARPHPAPAGGFEIHGAFAERHTFQFPVCLTSRPELVDLNEPKPTATVVGETRRVATTLRLEAVGQDWDGRMGPVKEMDYLPPGCTPLSRKVVTAAPRVERVDLTDTGFAFTADYLPPRLPHRPPAGSAHCDPEAAVRNHVWPAGWYDGKICSRYTSRTFDAAAGRTPGMVSTFIHSGPLSDLDGLPPHSGVSCDW